MRSGLLIAAAFLASGCRPPDPGAVIDDSVQTTGAQVGGHRIGSLRVIDGDTFEMAGEVVRIENIDTPEKPPRAKCQAEAALALVATRELDELLGASWSGTGSGLLPTLERSGRDRYGRTLATVRLATGQDVGEELVRRGVAAPWAGRREEWCK